MLTHLHQVCAELLEGLQQAGIPDLLDDEDTLRGLVPRQPLAGRVLDVPLRGEEHSHGPQADPLAPAQYGDPPHARLCPCLRLLRDEAHTGTCLEDVPGAPRPANIDLGFPVTQAHATQWTFASTVKASFKASGGIWSSETVLCDFNGKDMSPRVSRTLIRRGLW